MDIQTSSLVSSVRGGNALSSSKAITRSEGVSPGASASAVNVSIDIQQIAERIATDQAAPQPQQEPAEALAALRSASGNADQVVYNYSYGSNSSTPGDSSAGGTFDSSTDLTV